MIHIFAISIIISLLVFIGYKFFDINIYFLIFVINFVLLSQIKKETFTTTTQNFEMIHPASL
jgi:hypothetical protein